MNSPQDILRESRLLTGPWILYDGTCRFCQSGAQCFGPMLRRGFRLETLQNPLARQFITDTVDEMKVITRRGEILGGADGIAHICRHIWWTRPLARLWLLPPLRLFFRRLYAWIAARRHCLGGKCQRRAPPSGRVA